MSRGSEPQGLLRRLERVVADTLHQPAFEPVMTSVSEISPEHSRAPFVRRVVPEEMPLARTKPVKVGRVVVGGGALTWIAGPRGFSNLDQICNIAMALRQIGVPFLRAGVPVEANGHPRRVNRAALHALAVAAKRFDLQLISEAFCAEDVSVLAPSCSAIEVSGSALSDEQLIACLCAAQRPLLISRSALQDIGEFVLTLQKIARAGGRRVLIVDNGVAQQGGGVVFDLSTVVALRRMTPFPVLVNCSALVRDWTYAESVATSAIGAGADGLLIDVIYRKPEEGRAASDLLPRELCQMMRRAGAMKSTVNALIHYGLHNGRMSYQR